MRPMRPTRREARPAAGAKRTRLVGLLGAALAVPLADCRDPTEVTLDLRTDLACAELKGTGIAAGGHDATEELDLSTTTTQCDAARGGDGAEIGTLVLLPRADMSAGFGVKVVASTDGDVSRCAKPPYGPSCIVARRALRFIPHTPLSLRIDLRRACQGIACDPKTTCVNGACVSSEVDPGRCTGAGCDESALLGPAGDAGSDGGAPRDGAADSAADAPPDSPNKPEAGPPAFARLVGNQAGALMPRFLAVDAAANIYVVAELNAWVIVDGAPFSAATSQDAVVLKLDPAGKLIWGTHISAAAAPGSSSGPTLGAQGLAVDSQGDVVVGMNFVGTITVGTNTLVNGTGSEDIALLKLAGDTGSPYFFLRFAEQQVAGGPAYPQRLLAVAVDSQRNIILAGSFANNVVLPPLSFTTNANFAGLLAKLDPQGHALWGDVSDGAGASVTISGAAIDPNDSILIAGDAVGQVTFAGAPFNFGNQGHLVIGKVSATHQPLFARDIGAPAPGGPATLFAHPGGPAVLGGNFGGSFDFGGGPRDAGSAVFVASYAQDGGYLSDTELAQSFLPSTSIDGSGHMLLAGSMSGSATFPGLGTRTAAGNTDILVAHVTPQGAFQSATLYGDSATQIVRDAKLDANGATYLLGLVAGVTDFGQGTTPLTVPGATPWMFLAKIY